MGAKIYFDFGWIVITETIVNTWIIMAILTVFAIFSSRRFEKIPRGIQSVVEALVDIINKFTAQTMGEDKKGFSAYMGTLFLFLLLANLLGLLGLRPPTADLNTTFALSIMTFFIIHTSGLRSKGTKTYLKGFLEPFPAMLPLNVIGELALPISLAFRLFGNVVGGLIIVSLLYGGLASVSGSLGITFFPVLQAGIPVVFHMYFDLFSGVLQTFIFIMLSMVFISMAMD